MPPDDDHHARDEDRSAIFFTASESRRLLNLLDDAEGLQSFTEQQKQDLGNLLQGYAHLAALIDVGVAEHKELLRFVLNDLKLGERKELLRFLVDNLQHLKKNVDRRIFWNDVVRRMKWFGVQCAGLIAFIVALNEFYEKIYLPWRHH